MRLAYALAVLAMLSGCASSSVVGSIDLGEDLEPIRNRTLVVVPLGGEFGESPNVASRIFGSGITRDTVRLQEWVPLAGLQADTYAEYAVDAVADVLRSRGAWSWVRMGTLPDSAALTEQTYSVRMFVPARSKTLPRRVGVVSPPAGEADLFGADVDYVLIVQEAGVAFQKGDSQFIPTAPGMAPVMTKTDDSVVIGADLMLWDNRAGTVVAYGPVAGFAPIRSRVFSSAEERSASALIDKARQELVNSIREEFPGLLGQ